MSKEYRSGLPVSKFADALNEENSTVFTLAKKGVFSLWYELFWVTVVSPNKEGFETLTIKLPVDILEKFAKKPNESIKIKSLECMDKKGRQVVLEPIITGPDGNKDGFRRVNEFFELWPLRAFVRADDVDRLKDIKTALAVRKPMAARPKNQAKKGGRPPEPFTEAINYFFTQLFDAGEYGVLGGSNINNFLELLRKDYKKDDFLSARIESISKPGGIYKIKTCDFVRVVTKKREETIKGKVFTQNDVSGRLNNLRKIRPLP